MWSIIDWHEIQNFDPPLSKWKQCLVQSFLKTCPSDQTETSLHLRLSPCFFPTLFYAASVTFLLREVLGKLLE